MDDLISPSVETESHLLLCYTLMCSGEATPEETQRWESALSHPVESRIALQIKQDVDVMILNGLLLGADNGTHSFARKPAFLKAQRGLLLRLHQEPMSGKDDATVQKGVMYRLEKKLAALESALSDSKASYSLSTLVAASLLMIMLGGVLGYALFAIPQLFTSSAQVAKGPMPIGLRDEIANIRISPRTGASDPITIYYDVIEHAEAKGSLTNGQIKELLVYAITKEKNPGTRLDALALLHAIPNASSDPEIKRGLIRAFKYDSNAGVRNQAFSLLLDSPVDADTKMALLFALMNDQNAGIRISALNTLLSVGFRGERIDPLLLAELRERMKTEENQYIQLNVGTLLDAEVPDEK